MGEILFLHFPCKISRIRFAGCKKQVNAYSTGLESRLYEADSRSDTINSEKDITVENWYNAISAKDLNHYKTAISNLQLTSKNIKIVFLSILCLVFLTSCLTAGTTDNSVEDQAYRYTHKIKFKKVKAGEDLHHIYCPLPRNNDYQLISNIDTHGGEILDNPGSIEKYVRYTILPEQQPTKGDWGEVILEFDYAPTNTEYVTANVDKIYEYDTTSDIFKRYTTKYYDFFDIENATIKKISDELWKDATDKRGSFTGGEADDRNS